MTAKVVVIGGGWAGCGAAVAAAKAGAEVTLLERTDDLLGTGISGGFMNNNGRFTAAEEAKALGGGDLFEMSDSVTMHTDVEIPGHKHGTMYSAIEIVPKAREVVEAAGVNVRFETRISKVEKVEDESEGTRILSVSTKEGETFMGDVFVDCTGSTGGMPNCIKYGNGCCMCILRCPTFGGRVSPAVEAGAKRLLRSRPGGFGTFSGAIEVHKDSISPAIRQELERKGSVVIPLPKEFVDETKLYIKACVQYSLKEFAENIVLIHNGFAKIVSPFFPIHRLRQVKGFEEARIEEPLAGGRGNSVRYISMVHRDNTMKVEGFANLFCGGETGGPMIGHTEACIAGTLAGHNAARYGLSKELIELPRSLAIGDFVAHVREQMQTEEGLSQGYTFAGSTYFHDRMKPLGLYTTDKAAIRKRVEELGFSGIFSQSLV